MDRNRDALNLIAGALRLSANVLAARPEELPGQLQGRLLKFDDPPIRELRDDIEDRTRWPWLKSQWASLAAPDGLLIRTLAEHTGPVDAVALTGDGRVVSGACDSTLRIWRLDTGEYEQTCSIDAPVRTIIVDPLEDILLYVGDSIGRLHSLSFRRTLSR